MAKKAKLSSMVGDAPCTPTAVSDERKWKVEDALRTCEQYQKISKDKSLMKEVKAMAKNKIKDLEATVKKY